jgi:hypothetical protein
MFWFALHHSGKGGKYQDGPQRSITLRDITPTPVPTGELRSVVDIWDGRRAVLALNFLFLQSRSGSVDVLLIFSEWSGMLKVNLIGGGLAT